MRMSRRAGILSSAVSSPGGEGGEGAAYSIYYMDTNNNELGSFFMDFPSTAAAGTQVTVPQWDNDFVYNIQEIQTSDGVSPDLFWDDNYVTFTMPSSDVYVIYMGMS